MNIPMTEQQRARMSKFPVSDIYMIIKIIVNDIVDRSRKMRKSGVNADETHGNVRFGEGMEAGAAEVLNIINKLSK